MHQPKADKGRPAARAAGKAKTTPLTLHLTPATAEALKELAAIMDRSPEHLAKRLLISNLEDAQTDPDILFTGEIYPTAAEAACAVGRANRFTGKPSFLCVVDYPPDPEKLQTKHSFCVETRYSNEIEPVRAMYLKAREESRPSEEAIRQRLAFRKRLDQLGEGCGDLQVIKAATVIRRFLKESDWL